MVVTKYTELLSESEWTHLKENLGLPPRQGEVLRCVLGGMADKQTARTTGISVNSVRNHMTRLFRKFGVNDRVELILWVFGHVKEYRLPDNHANAKSLRGPTVSRRVRPKLSCICLASHNPHA
jgi:DNA-binding CsgD family transcriptional regulator